MYYVLYRIESIILSCEWIYLHLELTFLTVRYRHFTVTADIFVNISFLFSMEPLSKLVFSIKMLSFDSDALLSKSFLHPLHSDLPLAFTVTHKRSSG